ncbi:conjugal transfer protein [Zunongwangia sp. F363]|uniref:Conjugal transfer protein n=1 Tax=Autumnicola tepida TaxID=3075595 RepID=A0ABU3C780_9FLAO|nr:conjugal transfer protein [Zunongwangia sp. F363]MDT0642202.1 conjugal transfer protein [Zunongwangia sp. F363]
MKNKTKMLCLALAMVLLLPAGAACQGMPVYDNTNFISLAKQLIESAKQTAQLLKTVEFLKKQKENIEKVNAVVRQLKAVRELTRAHQRLYERVQNDARDILNSPYVHPEEISRISESFDAIIELSLRDLEFIDQVLSSDFLKMTDADRTQILNEKEKKSRELLLQVDSQLRRYRDIIDFRQLQEQLNSRRGGI